MRSSGIGLRMLVLSAAVVVGWTLGMALMLGVTALSWWIAGMRHDK